MITRHWRKVLLLLLVPTSLYGALLGTLYLRQEALIFPGTPLAEDHRFVFDVPFEEFSVPVEGATLNALLFRQPQPRGLVFFLHGNAGNLQSWTTGVDFYQRVNYDMFIFDYRGYGKSTGRIESEAQLFEDVQRAWAFIAPRYTGKPVVVYGRSLGTALAVELARKVDPALLVLVSPYISMQALARREYPYVPAELLRYPLRSDAMIADVDGPVLLMHGSEDMTIPPSHSRSLKTMRPGQTQLLIVEGAAHDNIHQFSSYRNGLALALP